jgi:hypothetical protein
MPGGQQGIFIHLQGSCDAITLTASDFEELARLPDVNDHGVVAFAARHRSRGLVATVVDFALNPVSINERGQMAIRVALEDGRQLILRADPAG